MISSKLIQLLQIKSITNRYYGHETFSFIASGLKTIINTTKKKTYKTYKNTTTYLIEGKELQTAKQLSVMKAQRKWPVAAYCKGSIYVLSKKFEINTNFMPFEKYRFTD